MNYIHWMVTNVPGSRTDEGDERFDYLPPWGFERNATNTGIIDTGDAAVHQVAVLAFKQPGTIDVTESARGCPESIFNRFISLTDFMAKYGLEGPAAGNMFWTKYGTWADEMNCYATSSGQSLVIRNLVEIKKALVDGLLKFKSSLYSIQGCSPLCGIGLGDVLVDHPAAPVGLILGQLDSMLALLIRLLLEVSCEPSQGLVVAVEIGSH